MGKLTTVHIDLKIGFSFDKSKDDKMEMENEGQPADFEMQVSESTEMKE